MTYTAYYDEHYDTWSVGDEYDTICDLWRLDEETHNRQPFENAEELAKLIAKALNFHDALRSALSEAVEEIKFLHQTPYPEFPVEQSIAEFVQLLKESA